MATLHSILDSNAFVRGGDAMVRILQSIYSELSTNAIMFDKFETTFSTYTGGMESSKDMLDELYESANRLGIGIEASIGPFARFAAASKDSIDDQQELLEIYEGINTGLVAVSASASETTGVWTAMTQMMSKGRVQSEELRQQLAERLPGAMKIAAESMGKTGQELNEALRTGLDPTVFIPAFSEAIKEYYGDAAAFARQKWQATLSVTANQYKQWLREIEQETKSTEIWSSVLGGFSEAVFENTDSIDSFKSMLNDLNTAIVSVSEILRSELISSMTLVSGIVDVLAKGVDALAVAYWGFNAAISKWLALSSKVVEYTYALQHNAAALKMQEKYTQEMNEANEFAMGMIKKNTDRMIGNSSALEENTKAKEENKKKGLKTKDVDALTDSVAKFTKELIKSSKQQNDSSGVGVKSAKEALKAMKEQLDMYSKLGVSSDAYYDISLRNLKEETKTWVSLGASQQEVDDYINNTLQKTFPDYFLTLDELGNYTNAAGEETDRFGNTLDYAGRISEELTDETEDLVDEIENMGNVTEETLAAVDDYTGSMNEAAAATDEAKTFLEEYNGVPLTAGLQRKIADDQYLADLKQHQIDVFEVNKAAYLKQAVAYQNSMEDQIVVAKEAVDEANDYAIEKTKEKAQQLYNIEEKRIQNELALAKELAATDDTKLSAMRQMYNDQEVVSSDYFQAEADSRMRQAQEWKDAGVNALKIEEWLQGEFEDLRTEATEAGVQGLDAYMQSLWASSKATGNFSQDLVDAQSEINGLEQELANLQAAGVDSFMDEASASMKRFNQDVVNAQNYLNQLVRDLTRFNNSENPYTGLKNSENEGYNQKTYGGDSRSGMYISASQHYGSNSGSAVQFFFNQNVSRNDVNNITSSQLRNASR